MSIPAASTKFIESHLNGGFSISVPEWVTDAVPFLSMTHTFPPILYQERQL